MPQSMSRTSTSIEPGTTLARRLDAWVAQDGGAIHRSDVAATIAALGHAGKILANVIAAGDAASASAAVAAGAGSGDSQKQLDVEADAIVMAALQEAPVALVASEEGEHPVAVRPGAPLPVAVDPLDGSSNIDTNAPIGTIFSIMLARLSPASPESGFIAPISTHLAAGYIIYGPRCALVVTLGERTEMYGLDPVSRSFKLAVADVEIPRSSKEFAINMSNNRHWRPEVRAYVEDCLEGAEGPMGKDFNMRWLASAVGEAHRILMRGGIYLYPADDRKGYTKGRLRLLYEGAPLGMVIEAAGGRATDGETAIAALSPTGIHQRTPLVFGSADDVARFTRYTQDRHAMPERAPLFKNRGLFRN